MNNEKTNKNTNLSTNYLFLFLSIVLLITFAIISYFIITNSYFIISIDNYIFNFVNSIRSKFINNLALFITFLGETVTIVFLLIVSVFLLRKKSIQLIICISSSSLISFILKNLIQRPRPVGQFVENLIINYPFPNSFSFPSGHSQNSLVFYFILANILVNTYYKGRHKTLILSISIILPVLIMISRIILGVHYFTDILGGAILGFIVISLYLLFNKFSDRNKFNKA